MQDAILFLPGKYTPQDLPYFSRLSRGRFKVAVDGGYRFFAETNTTPDLLIGDFDSIKHKPTNLPRKTKVIEYPQDKDKTDTHLALEYCLERKAQKIDIVQTTLGAPDHFLCNVQLLELADRFGAKSYHPEVRIINRLSEIALLIDGSREIRRAAGDTLSVIPLSESIELRCRGTAYDVDRLVVARGETISARNRVEAANARIRVSGRALVIRLYRRAR
ncbi:MAG: thiamine diphosphokinase [candidate division Zixibacteria bacterium]|nr:thiamine diphosphokinase [candidate division Zixibacteria bacterium]